MPPMIDSPMPAGINPHLLSTATVSGLFSNLASPSPAVQTSVGPAIHEAHSLPTFVELEHQMHLPQIHPSHESVLWPFASASDSFPSSYVG